MTASGVFSRAEIDTYIAQTYFFVEHLNSWCARLHHNGQLASSSLKNVVLQVLVFFREGGSFGDDSEVVRAARAMDLLPQPNIQVLEVVGGILLRPVGGGAGQFESAAVGAGEVALPVIEAAHRLREHISIFEIDSDRVSFATSRYRLGSLYDARGLSGIYFEEPLDPIAIAQGVLLRLVDSADPETVNSYIQSWIRRHFGLFYNDALKYSMARVARGLNTLFFGRAVPTREDVHLVRSTTLGVDLLLVELRELLGGSVAPQGVLGLYLVLRFCRLVRLRYHRFPDKLKVSAPKEELLRSAADGKLCVTALRAVEYSFLVARLFGTITEMRGLNFIFRGGIIPRTASGRTMAVLGPPGAGKTVFALQKLAGVASRGGFAAYLSVEEPYELVVERLVVFGLYRPGEFYIARHFKDVADAPASLGVLLLVSSEDESEGGVPLDDLVEKLVALAGERWKRRAIAIDSINAVGLGNEPLEIRRRLNSLIGKVERAGFLAIILGEEDPGRLASLPYLADTIIHFGFDETKRTRWLEIVKCRSQNFHPGRHGYRLSEGRGVRIYPSLGAVRSALRRRTRSTLSRIRRLEMPEGVELVGGENWLAEKSSVLVYGPENRGKTFLALRLASTVTAGRKGVAGDVLGPRSALVVTFRTTERRFVQTVKEDPGLSSWWDGLRYRRIRWYSPGENMSGAQVIDDLSRYIHESRRLGVALERVVLDEAESADLVLPMLRKEPLFWTTLLDVFATEAITAFIIFGEGSGRGEVFEALRLGVDYVMRMSDRNRLIVEKRPDLKFSGEDALTDFPAKLGE